jgi:hypothetical protein
VTSPEYDFWDEPDNIVNIFPKYNVWSKAQKRILTAKQSAMIIFNNDRTSAVKILYQKNIKKKLGTVPPSGKSCEIMFLENKVLAYKTKAHKTRHEFGTYTPEQKQSRSASKKLDV